VEEDSVAAKKAKRPALRYLLSADSKLRKLSIKKLSERGKATATKRAARTKVAVARPESLGASWTPRPRAFAFALVGVIVAATLMTAGPMPQRSESTDPAMAPLSESRLVAAPSSERPARAEKAAAPSKRPRPSEPSSAPVAKTVPVAVAAPVPEAASPDPVTISGCLAKNSDGFWLKNASGADLSAARSWRTGFFKKGSPRVNVTPASAAVKLADHVGHRVSATGVLADQNLRARSVRRIATSCD
jgi:hypothetical protein